MASAPGLRLVVRSGKCWLRIRRFSPWWSKSGYRVQASPSMFSGDFVSNPTAQKSDFDLFGSTGLGDLVIFSGQFLGANQAQLLCP